VKIKALIFDLDGTAIPKRPDGMPSQTVIDAVNAAKKKCHVSIATGRPFELCEDVLAALGIEDVCIVNGGTHLYSAKAKECVWKQEMTSEMLKEVFGQLNDFQEYFVADEKRMNRVPLLQYVTDDPIGLTCVFSTSENDAQKIVSIVQQCKGLCAHAASSWKDGTFDIHISHEQANKKYALESLLSQINVGADEIMVAGDSGNDLPLFAVGGLRVAMGNASQELKDRADWIAPTVDEDGLAVAIEKFILNEA
jgi:HAD superfamily hydrolase (TIGR01484 family)